MFEGAKLIGAGCATIALAGAGAGILYLVRTSVGRCRPSIDYGL